MIGTDATTGKPISGTAHLRQSVGDILTTPIGSRVMRRDYGSLLPQLIDQPLTPATAVRLYAATAAALMRWEPRIKLQRVRVERQTDGSVLLTMDGTRTDGASPGSLQTITLPLIHPLAA